ncbi:MAG: thiol reductant ABC exporter subunit CydD [Phyllobacterium sp.]
MSPADEFPVAGRGSSETGAASGAKHPSRRKSPERIDRGSMLQAFASLLWIPQAGFLAYAVQCIASGEAFQSMMLAAVAVLLLGICRSLLEGYGVRLSFRDARARLSALRGEAAFLLGKSSPLDIEKPISGQAASIITEQAEAITPYLSRYRPAQFKCVVVPVAILLAIVPFTWLIALVLLVAVPLIPLFMALIGWRAKAASEEHLAEMGGMNGFLLDRLRGLATIRSLGAVDLTARRLRANAESLRRRTMMVLRIAFLSSAVLELFAALGVAMVAVFVGFHLLGQVNFGMWGEKLTLGQGLFVILLAPAFFDPLRELSAVWHDRAAGVAAIEAMEGLAKASLPLPAAFDEGLPVRRTFGRAPDVQLQALTFAYPAAARTVLKAIDFHVASGERIALVGPSGSGKSTLLALVAGLAPTGTGAISVDGELLTDTSAAQLRSRMSWIGQKPHIFAGSMRANLTMGRGDMSDEDLLDAFRKAALDGVAIANWRVGLGEAGLGLSGGEALRLAMARAAAKPDVDLILADEPTAHLDSSTAEQVTEGLLKLAKGKTLIVATHDPLLAMRMDRVVHLEDFK